MSKYRNDSERSPEVIAFLAAVVELQQKHGFAIYHEDSGHGGYEVVRREGNESLAELADEWIEAAAEVVS